MTINTPHISKKLTAAIAAAVIGYLAIRDGMTEQQIGLILSPFLLYLPSQGIADMGKEVEREKAKTAKLIQ